LFQIALAIEHSGMSSRFGIPRARNDRASRFLLVDEIENGVHYTRHIEMWRSIFKIARLLGVQVFASTHSWDCIEGFQAVASEDSACEGALIRLEKSADSIRAVTFSEDELSIATRDNIEVR
jgi:predicted ATP-dependent endonuclease of OLD family